MSPPSAFHELEDEALVLSCIADDDAAWFALADRYGRLADTVVVRAMDERRPGSVDEARGFSALFFELARDDDAGMLRRWRKDSTLRAYLALVARRAAVAYAENATPTAAELGAMRTPLVMIRGDVGAFEPVDRIVEVAEKLPASTQGLLRMCARGLDHTAIAGIVGTTPAQIVERLTRVSELLIEPMRGDPALLAQAMRLVLGATTTAEHARWVVRSSDDETFQALRLRVEGAWRAVREQLLALPCTRREECPDETDSAGFVDGTLRGAERARIETHAASCMRCVDEMSHLLLDLRAAKVLKESTSASRDVAAGAACVASGRYRAGELLVEKQAQNGDGLALEIHRIARLATSLVGAPRTTQDRSRVSAKPLSAKRAPLAAFEALASNDPSGALRLLDEPAAKTLLGARLSLLASAASGDHDEALRRAELAIATPHSEPALVADAETILAVLPSASFPRTLLVERLRDAIEDVVRYALLSA